MTSFLKIPERVHQGLLLITAFAEAYGSKESISLESVAEWEGVSQGYLEQIVGRLRKAGLVKGKRGKSGGYRLVHDPARLTLRQVIEALEGPLEMVGCTGEAGCDRSADCNNAEVWRVVQGEMLHLFDSLTIEEVLDLSRKDEG
jgi:Rrf2 family protein